MSPDVKTWLQSDIWTWLKALVRNWVAIAGCALFAVFQICYAIWRRDWLPVLSWGISCCLVCRGNVCDFADRTPKTIGKQRRRILEKVVQLVRDHPEEVDTLGAVARLSDNFRSEEDVEWVCQQLDEYGHSDPFVVLDESFEPGFAGKRLKFLQDARVAPGQVYSIRDAMRYVAFTWASKNGLTARRLSDRDRVIHKFFYDIP